MKLRRRTAAAIAVAVACVCLTVSAVVAWRVQRVLRGAERYAASQGLLGVEVRTLAAQPNPGFNALVAPAVFRNAILFQGNLYLSGPAGLYAYAADGTPQRTYRVGIDLPAAPLGQMAVGMLNGARQPELLIATGGAGVLSFDGQRFRQICPDPAEARDVTALLPLGSGRLLMGTAKLGLLIYDGKILRQFHPTTNNIYVTALAGTEAELWVGTLNQGLLWWRGGQTQRIGEAEGLPDRRVEQIALADDVAYVGTPMGVAEVRAGRVARVLAAGRYAHALMVDGGGLLVGQVEAGIVRVPLAAAGSGAGARRPIEAREGLWRAAGAEGKLGQRGSAGDEARGGFAASLYARKPISFTVEQFLAVGESRYALAADGLLRREPDGEWRQVLNGGSALLTDRHISALMVASDGRLWVGYFDRGLDIVSPTGGKVEHVENEHVFCVNRIVEDAREGAVAVATANGLVLFDRDGRQRQVLGREAGLIAEDVSDVALYGGGVAGDGAGSGMALATPAGITFLDSSGAHSLYAFEGLGNNHVYALGVRGDELVSGTLGGISLLTGGRVRANLKMATSGLKANWITALAAAGGDWLVGTYGEGVMRLAADGQVTQTAATQAGMVVNPTAMVADGRLVLVGTLSRGLQVGDRTGTRWKTVTAGLPSLNVTAVAIRDGVVYVGTANGLVKISEDQL